MKVFAILAVVVFGALVAGRFLDSYFGLGDGSLSASVVGPVLFFGGLYAAFRAYKDMRRRRQRSGSPYIGNEGPIADDGIDFGGDGGGFGD